MKAIRSLFISIAVFWAFKVLIHYVFQSGSLAYDQFITDACEDEESKIEGTFNRWHQRNWSLETGIAGFCTSYITDSLVSLQQERHRNSITPRGYDYEVYWGEVYYRMVEESKLYLGEVIDSLKKEAAWYGDFSKKEMAEMVVSFVQDIPYSYVLASSCEEKEGSDSPCIGHVDHGVLSPYEFLHTLYGDCDTRAVLIYALLEELGFDPMVVISREYRHAMLAIKLPASGDHISYEGENYYFWETTAKGWPVGMLPPSYKNIDYWKVALVKSKAYES